MKERAILTVALMLLYLYNLVLRVLEKLFSPSIYLTNVENLFLTQLRSGG